MEGTVIIRKTQRYGDPEEDILPIGSSPKCLQQPGVGQAEVRNQESHLGFPHACLEPKHLGHYMLPPTHISRKPDLKQRQDSM